jgi:hypothetical protein
VRSDALGNEMISGLCDWLATGRKVRKVSYCMLELDKQGNFGLLSRLDVLADWEEQRDTLIGETNVSFPIGRRRLHSRTHCML